MAKTGKKTTTKKVVETLTKAASNKVLLRSASTGVFSEGKKPCVACSPSGNKGGVPFWEV